MFILSRTWLNDDADNRANAFHISDPSFAAITFHATPPPPSATDQSSSIVLSPECSVYSMPFLLLSYTKHQEKIKSDDGYVK
ncbi:hypothetical protein N7454_007171 [Penicillium verhagenii]|nr:hypothetical protein N7454_007171 [Penicillium verhagenii]